MLPNMFLVVSRGIKLSVFLHLNPWAEMYSFSTLIQ